MRQPCGHDPMILLVEDDEDIRETLSEILRSEGFDIEAVANGQEAMVFLNRRHPCIILLDLMMPVMNGWQVIDAIRRDPLLQNVPFCILSAIADSAAPGDAECVIQKPVNLTKLIQVVRRCCSEEKSSHPST